MNDDDVDTIPADPDEDETALGVDFITDGSTPDEKREVGTGVGDDG